MIKIPDPTTVMVPYTVLLNHTLLAWLKDSIGEGNYTHFFPRRLISFAYAEDATAFIMKFGGYIKDNNNPKI